MFYVFNRWSVSGRSRSLLFSLLLCAVVLIGQTLSAQTNEALFRGTWVIETPEDGSLLLLVKRLGRASYFWGDNTDRTVYQGSWTLEQNAVVLSWVDGSQHRIAQASTGFLATFIDSEGREGYTSLAQQVPAEVLGEMAKGPERPEDEQSDRDQARGFFGIWRIGEGADEHFVFVEPDRSAATNRSDDPAFAEGLRGSWARQGSELHIVWDSGHYSILRRGERGFSYKRVPAGVVIEDDAGTFNPASRTNQDSVPHQWLSVYQNERVKDAGGIAFTSRSEARSFYRGFWIVRRGQDAFERIEITRFGNLKTTRDQNLGGDWMMSGQDIFMRWDNGIRKILSPVGRGFVLYEYAPGRPLDGVPTRLHPAIPADTEKLAAHMQGRAYISEELLASAETAGVNAQAQSSGWGRTFARWAWPFGTEGDGDSAEAILEEGYTGGAETDPWWWPFWSENASASSGLTSVPEEPQVLETDGPSDAPESTIAPESTTLIQGPAAPRAATTPDPVRTDGIARESASNAQAEPVSARTSVNPPKSTWYWPF